MLDTSSRANFKPTAEIDDLDALAKEVSKHLQASAAAAQNFLEHAIAAGDALIRAKAQVKHGDWLKWLKSCDLSADTAERYMKLARHRDRAEFRTRAEFKLERPRERVEAGGPLDLLRFGIVGLWLGDQLEGGAQA